MKQEPPLGQGLLITEDTRPHTGTPHTVEILWTIDQPESENST